MKIKPRFLLLLSVLALLLPGCSSLAGQATTSSDLTLTEKTGLGILILEGQTLEVDSTQAKEMLPLWQALQSLSTDANTAPEEITALNEQIEQSLTADQLTAIDDMNWNSSELESLIQKYSSDSQAASTGTSDQTSASSGSQGNSAGMDAGGPPMDGGGEMMMAGAGGSQMASVVTSHADLPSQSEREEAAGMNLVFARAVITLLQSKINLA